jgi:hypothetical protein
MADISFKIIIIFEFVHRKLQAKSWRVGVRFQKYFSILHSVYTSSGAHIASCPMGTVALHPVVMWPGREADHSSPSGAKVKNGGVITPLPYTSL